MVFPPDKALLSDRLGIFIIDIEDHYLGTHKTLPGYKRLIEVNSRLVQFALENPQRTRLYLISTDIGDDTIRASFPKLRPLFQRITPGHVGYISKGHNSGYEGTKLLCRCANNNIGAIIVGGINSTACVAATLADGLKHEQTLMLPSDSHMNASPLGTAAPAIDDVSNDKVVQRVATLMRENRAVFPSHRLFSDVGTTAQLLAHITSVWKRHQSPAADSPLPSLPSATALQGPSSAPLGLV